MYWNFSEILVKANDPPFSGEGPPLVVEIGFGNGEYLEHLARARPETLVIGIEVSQWCLTKAARRALACGLKNVRLMLGDARYLLRHAFEPHSVSEAYMNFPCPWPKRRHAERRVARPQFADLMNVSLREGGTFTLATDVDWYALETHAVFSAHGDFETGPVELNPAREYHTKYERKWLEEGRSTYVQSARKISGAVAGKRMGGGVEDVESVEISAACEADGLRDKLASIKGDILENDEYRVVFRDVFFAADGTALVMAISVDEGFEQHYYLRMIPSKGVLRGKVDAVGHPYRTPGVRASVKHIMRKAGAKF